MEAFTACKNKRMYLLAAWSAFLRELDRDTDDLSGGDGDQHKAKRTRPVYPRPDNDAAPWSRELRQPCLEEPTSRAYG